MANFTDKPLAERVADPLLDVAARRIFDDHYRMLIKQRWEDMSAEPNYADLGRINYKYLCLSLAFSVLNEVDGRD